MDTRAMEYPHGRESREAAPAGQRPGRIARSLRLLTALALVAVVVPACHSSRADDSGTTPTPTAQARTTVTVENRSFLDHNVFVLRGGQRVRLGLVTGNSSQTFTIPSNLVFGVTSLSFLVDPVGGARQPVSNELPVSAGDAIQLIIPPA